jgi:hypothetical protein
LLSEVIAEIRRRVNGDLLNPEFREMLPTFLNSLHELLPTPCASRADLIQQVYGFGVRQLHPDISQEQAAMDRVKELVACQQKPQEVNAQEVWVVGAGQLQNVDAR